MNKMITPDDDYEMVGETETDILIADFPIDLLKENLKSQIDKPLSTDVNYLEIVLDRYRVLKADYGEIEDVMMTLNNSTIEFLTYIIESINDKFDLSLNLDLYDNLDDCIEGASNLYHFLILRYRKNVTKFIFKYINKNKKFLIETFESESKKKDVTTIANKKKIKNRDDALIISNLPNIISYIMSLEFENLELLKYMAGDDNYEAAYIRRLVLEGNLLSNFVQDYLDVVVTDYNDVMDEIQTDIKTKLMRNK